VVGGHRADGRGKVEAVRTLSASSVHTLKVWDLEAGFSVVTFRGDSSFYTCTVAPDDRTVVAGDAGGQVHILCLEGMD
jgi:WD40 repeat protein